MKPASPLMSVFATILLHAALIALVIAGLRSEQKVAAIPKPVPVQLLQEQAQTLAQPAPATAAAAPPVFSDLPGKPRVPARPPHHKHAEAAARATPQPAMQQRESAAPPHPAPVTPVAPFVTTGISGAAIPSIPAQPAPSAPVKTGASIPASYAATNRKPPYPRLSRQNEEQGVVQLRVFVKADGTAGEVQVAASSGYALLDESAKSTVQTWRFNPATVDGKPVGEWYRVPVPFTLHD